MYIITYYSKITVNETEEETGEIVQEYYKNIITKNIGRHRELIKDIIYEDMEFKHQIAKHKIEFEVIHLYPIIDYSYEGPIHDIYYLSGQNGFHVIKYESESFSKDRKIDHICRLNGNYDPLKKYPNIENLAKYDF